MKNKSPIILNCFSRGGSNILWNFFLSHPSVLHPIEETIQIFNTTFRAPRFEGYKIVMMENRFVFRQWEFKEISPVSIETARYIDTILFNKKMKNLQDSEMKYKTSSVKYSPSEIKNTRLVIKNNNGLVFCTNMFSKIYPDASFIGLIRHPVPLFESHKRRKTPVSKSIETFVDYYKKIAKKIKNDQKIISNYHIIKFEELLYKPIPSLEKLYSWTNLDFSMVEEIRLKAKPFMKDDGSHSTKFTKNKHYWFKFDDVFKILEPKVNDFQSKQLSQKESQRILDLTESIREDFGYSI